MPKTTRGLIAAGLAAAGLPLVLMTTAASAAPVTPKASAVRVTVASAPAMVPAASEANCVHKPSNNNCNGAEINEAGACWDTSYVLQPTSGGEYFYDDQGYLFETDLRYSTGCKSKFSVTEVIRTGSGVYVFSSKVRRSPGLDGPYLMEHGESYLAYPWSGGGVVISPLVYAPREKAQACFSNTENDQVGCTGWY
jgi:hypothetical protein